MRRHLGLALTLACGSAAGQSLADRGPPPQRLFHRSVIGARVNPLGLVYDGRLTYRLRLYENESLPLRDNFVGGGLAAQISPASPDQGFTVTSDLDVLYVGLGQLVAGLRYSAAVPFYRDDSYQPGEPHENDDATQRVGPLLAYTFSVRDGAAFTAPTVFLLVQWWLDHRYRTGAEVSQGLPLIGIGFGFRGDLLPFD